MASRAARERLCHFDAACRCLPRVRPSVGRSGALPLPFGREAFTRPETARSVRARQYPPQPESRERWLFVALRLSLRTVDGSFMSCVPHVYEYFMLTVPIICFLVRNLQWQYAENDCNRPLMVRPRRLGGRPNVAPPCFAVPAAGAQAWRAEPALPPPRGCRNANQLAPRAECEYSTRLPMLREPRRA